MSVAIQTPLAGRVPGADLYWDICVSRSPGARQFSRTTTSLPPAPLTARTDSRILRRAVRNLGRVVLQYGDARQMYGRGTRCVALGTCGLAASLAYDRWNFAEWGGKT